MTRSILNRRQFFSLSAEAARNSLILLSAPAILSACSRATTSRLEGEDFQILSAIEANEFDAISARIMPSDDSPGAMEAGVIYFMDTVLNDDREAELAVLRTGLSELQASANAAHGVDYFHELSAEQQDDLLREIEQGQFFGTLRFLTIAGMFSLPEYGGNQNYIGYEVIGYDNRHAWAPPFGFYDDQANGGGQ